MAPLTACRALAKTTLFTTHTEHMDLHERFKVSYARAQAIGRAYGPTAVDVLELSQKFFDMHTDPILTLDAAAATLITLQYNCCAGTIAAYAVKRPDLKPVLQKVLAFEVSGQFCLTEVGHGLDARSMETTATLLPDGSFDLHTPREEAAKYMPPTTPVGIPCISVVFAKLVVGGEDCGVKPFLVELHDGNAMSPGVQSRLLSHRGGSRPVNHSLTYFDHVQLPSSALLGVTTKPSDPRAEFFKNIFRVAVGTLGLGSGGASILAVSACIAARYSLRRTVLDPASGASKPIISFRTQKTPIVTALAQAYVMRAMANTIIQMFRNAKDFPIQHALATILKVTAIDHAKSATLSLGDRCGSQGLFEVNQLSALFNDLRGIAIAEGDLLVISIRLASELLLGRYKLPPTSNPDSLLARHEAGLFSELQAQLAAVSNHRSDDYDRLILPHSMGLIQAIGYRVAYDAAVSAHINQDLVDLYVASCVRLDPAWYVEYAGISRATLWEMETNAVDRVFAKLDQFLTELDLDDFLIAPFVTDTAWKAYVETLETFGAKVDVATDPSPPHLSVSSATEIVSGEILEKPSSSTIFELTLGRVGDFFNLRH